MLPNLIIIGAKKCATTSLHYYLSLHPEIYMSTHKELNFFVEDLAWEKGLAWYEKQFPVAAKIRGESSPNYTQFPVFCGVAGRMHSILPEAKLIYMVREPVEQMISAYLQDIRAGIETRPLGAIINSDSDMSPYVYGARYHLQLEQYLNYYPASQILVMACEDLKLRTSGAMREIFEFLDVNPAFWSDQFHTLSNVQGEQVRRKSSKLERFAAWEGWNPRLGQSVKSLVPLYLKLRKRKGMEPKTDVSSFMPSPELKKRLRNFFQDDIEKLRDLTGQSFADWSAERPQQ